jgi:hypothetical protein
VTEEPVLRRTVRVIPSLGELGLDGGICRPHWRSHWTASPEFPARASSTIAELFDPCNSRVGVAASQKNRGGAVTIAVGDGSEWYRARRPAAQACPYMSPCRVELCRPRERSRVPLEPFSEGLAARLTGRHS